MDTSLYLIVGLGLTGHSIARYLKRRNKSFIVFDTRLQPPGLDAFHQEFPEIKVYTGNFDPALYPSLAAIISSPGVPLDQPWMQKAKDFGIPVYGDIECLALEVKAPVIAITGTNGKSTVTTLVGEMAKSAGLSVAVAGNIGLPVLDMLDVGVPYSLWVLELSSFQLDLTLSLAPVAATILNITPDHLDRHHTMAAYTAAKQRIYQRAKTSVYNRDDDATYPQDIPAHAKLISYGLHSPSSEEHWGLVIDDQTTYLACGKQLVMPVDKLRIKGRHNWMNALAACALADSVGISQQHMINVLERFAGLPHRCQWIRTLDDVDWINDSKGTNVGATLSAIEGIGDNLNGKIILIAGGQSKDADFSQLAKPVVDYVRSVVLIGQDADKIEEALPDTVDIHHAVSLGAATHIAKAQAQPGDVVLLSPACASLDMFRDFNHRGDEFIAAVNAL
ncbi:MAG: UDP-N-acetylmuramoyl-L-alanine--D-glutamate ligase [Legionella sp.]